MSKIKTNYVCQECSYRSPQWVGKCPECGSWNSLNEETITNNKVSTPSIVYGENLKNRPKLLADISMTSYERYTTGISEFDRVLGGGITNSSLVMLSGGPGVGKSSLLMMICGKLTNIYSNKKILYISGEESESQVANRCHRLNVASKNLYILHETLWQNMIISIRDIRPDFLIIDSIQTTISSEVQSSSGSTAQIKEVTYEIMNYAKAQSMTCFIIGHITKDGNIAGPKTLEHMVDTVLTFEGDRLGQYRILRGIKNRFGNTNEVGIFEMTEIGLKAVANASKLFIELSDAESFGRSQTCTLEGPRSILLEVQALTIENKYAQGKRIANGLDNNRLTLLSAIIDKYLEIPLVNFDIFINVVGGMKLVKRESDLSVISSILSSYFKVPISNDIVFMGEVGLTGEVRPVSFVESRLRELAGLNYKKVYLDYSNFSLYQKKYPFEIIGVKNIIDLKNYLSFQR